MKRLLVMIAMVFGMVATMCSAQSVMAQSHKDAGHAACGTECNTCASVCEKTVAYCQKHGGKHTEAKHINAIKDCITTCKASHDFITRGSDLQNKACSLCEQACSKCAESCETFKDDKTMKDCAEECRKCAASCHKMAG